MKSYYQKEKMKSAYIYSRFIQEVAFRINLLLYYLFIQEAGLKFQ